MFKSVSSNRNESIIYDCVALIFEDVCCDEEKMCCSICLLK
jgi:hypothetical protein